MPGWRRCGAFESDGLTPSAGRTGALPELIGLIATFTSTAALFVFVVLEYRAVVGFSIEAWSTSGRTPDVTSVRSFVESALPP